MKNKYIKKEVLNKILEKLNQKGFKKDSLYERHKEELKQILKSI